MKTSTPDAHAGSTLVVTIAVVVAILVLLGGAVEYTTHISRLTQRSRKTAMAMEIADGHLENLFTSWRNTYRTTWVTSVMGVSTANLNGASSLALVGTNYFYTDLYKPGTGCSGCPTPSPVPNMSPSATPPVIPLPPTTLFPTESGYQVTQYRIQAVDPMISLDANENAIVEGGSSKKGDSSAYALMSAAAIPPSSYGPNDYQYSYYYLASVDVKVPTLTGDVTAKVRRIFEKKFDQPWTFAFFFVDDLEFQPSSALTVNGPVHTNANLYIGSNYFTATNICEYGGDYVNGYSPNDPRYVFPCTSCTSPNFPQNSVHDRDIPPAQVSPYLPFGWNLSISTAAGSGSNNDSYHEIIERPTGTPDQFAGVRFYNQPGVYRVIVNSAGTGLTTADRLDSAGNTQSVATSTYTSGSPSILTFNKALFDARENDAVKVIDVDIAKLSSSISGMTGWNGVLYLGDEGAQTLNVDGTVKRAGTAVNVTINGTTYSTKRRAFRLINGYSLPYPSGCTSVFPSTCGLTIVSESPVYIQGNYNTGTTASATVPSNAGASANYLTPTATGYNRRAATVIADAVTILSGAWNDSNSNTNNSNARTATNTTINTAIVAGNVPSNGTSYSGGGENFLRLLEDWHSNTLCYYGSLVQLYASNQARGPWNSSGTIYKPPLTQKIYYDDVLFSTETPPGKLEIAAYLQQQRWYQVY
jgi:hypothetical protein